MTPPKSNIFDEDGFRAGSAHVYGPDIRNINLLVGTVHVDGSFNAQHSLRHPILSLLSDASLTGAIDTGEGARCI